MVGVKKKIRRKLKQNGESLLKSKPKESSKFCKAASLPKEVTEN
jgi:hypothetical protein